MKVSYCSSCKGRLKQLKKTLLPNLEVLRNIDAEWIIVDYFCPDNTSEEILKLPEVREMMYLDKLKIYKFTKDIPFYMTLSKNLSHSNARGDYIFNLDIDNYIGDSYQQVLDLPPRHILVTDVLIKRLSNGSGGRLAYPRKAFFEIGGYDLELDSIAYDDINIYERLTRLGFKPVFEQNVKEPILNTPQETIEYIENIRPVAEMFQNSRRISSGKIRSKIYHANEKGMLMYKEEDMYKYLERVYCNGVQGNVVTRL